MHTLLGYDTSVSEEIAVKWYEMSVLGLPSTALSSFFGPLNLLATNNIAELTKLNSSYIPHIMSCTRQLDNKEFFMNIYFEKEFETDVDVLRERMGIVKYEEEQVSK